jgi:glycosyltransferase involved in cell wall biosynthesis
VADYDVYFAAANRGLPLRSVGRTKLAFGLLDVIPLLFPRLYLFRHKFYHIRRDLPSMLLSLWRADEVITISEASARDIKRLFPRKRITPILIRLGGKVMTASMPKKQFIYVGGNDPRKRIDSLVRAFAVFHASHPDFKLVLLGKGYEPFNDLIKHLQIDFAIDQPGYVNETTKWRLLSESQAVVYPSLYEGYGLAIGEAFLAGVPVICGKGGAQREVGGDAALYIDPMGPASITTAMEQVLDQSERARLQNLGKKQLATLTDPAIETATVDFFTKLAEQARA